jgi:hypothetical protein
MLRKFIVTVVLPVALHFGNEAWAGPLDHCSAVTPSGCVTKNVAGKVQEGFTFLDVVPTSRLVSASSRAPEVSVLIDTDGNIIHTWTLGGWSRMLPGGHLLAGFYYPDMQAAGQTGQNLDCIVEVDWEGHVVWPPGAALIDIPGLPGRFGDSTAQIVTLGTDEAGRPVTRVHNDFQRKDNPVGYQAPGQESTLAGGTTLILALDVPPLETTVHISNYPLHNDKIYEVEVNNDTHILWEWNPVEHFEPADPGDLGLGFSQVAKDAIRLLQVIPFVDQFQYPDRTDWLHSNSASYLGANQWCLSPDDASCDLRFHPDNVLWNAREANVMGIIARHDHPHGLWQSGDLVWRVGPDYGDEPGKLNQVIGANHVHMIPRGLQGAGNILLFDNGGAAGFGADQNGVPAHPTLFRPYSRVIEFDPITLDVIWLYERRDPTPPPGENFAPFRSGFLSGAQRLANGNTLITEGMSGRVFEVTRAGELVWEFVSPFGPQEPYNGGDGNLVYRAFRVPTNWMPEQGN